MESKLEFKAGNGRTMSLTTEERDYCGGTEHLLVVKEDSKTIWTIRVSSSSDMTVYSGEDPDSDGPEIKTDHLCLGKDAVRLTKPIEPESSVSEPESAAPGKFKIGDKVRIKASVTQPTHNWTHHSRSDSPEAKEIGKVMSIKTEASGVNHLKVDFPSFSRWNGHEEEFELAEDRVKEAKKAIAKTVKATKSKVK